MQKNENNQLRNTGHLGSRYLEENACKERLVQKCEVGNAKKYRLFWKYP